MMWQMILKGAMISGGLIMAIGAQNAFVLRQGLLKQHVLAVATICFLCDFALISVGVLGLGGAIARSQTASVVLAILGAMFLLWYGFRSCRSALVQQHDALQISENAEVSGSLKQTALATLAITLLNPHVYLDTVVLIGSVSGSLAAQEKPYFLLGAVSVSFIWFFGLAYGARLLKPIFAKPRAWQILEMAIALMMWWLAYGLIRFVLNAL
ncbi:LysE/ArgO family amino acid transporter [Alysiella crassa]|uniref:Arginine exporter protein ArgO n=1 Tax=Alysiella crassa TaxID=153491 RepID=A0A376BL87_9NEIS|nr:LysE/ArgO family amino acid transporter [Alysiella crassa]UOP07418.1 LysE/ArgO family amino acid transporter [Alysiella crassa]SSY70395.1 Arginine exporter protein ArgO [Alysiella crassa]